MTVSSEAAKPEVFTRKASGLVRVHVPHVRIHLQRITMGLIFPWTYLWAPGALPGGKMVWGILLAMVIEIPIAFTYVWLSTALPRSGGDYVFQSRVFGGGVAFTVVMSGYVHLDPAMGSPFRMAACLPWLSPPCSWVLAQPQASPSLSAISVSGSPTSWGIVITSILNALVALLILASRFQELRATANGDGHRHPDRLRHHVRCPVRCPSSTFVAAH